MNNLSAGSKAASEVSTILRARNPLIRIVSKEETRVENCLIEAFSAAQYAPVFWDCASGLTKFDGQAVDRSLTDPVDILRYIGSASGRQVFVLRDLTPWLKDPNVSRALRSLVRKLTLAERSNARAIVLICAIEDYPAELSDQTVTMEWPSPDRQEITAILDSAIAALPDDIRVQAALNGAREAAIDAAVGLSAEEAQSCYAKSLVASKRIDPATVAAEKKRVIAKEKVLEWFDPLPGGLDSVGGLDCLKAWLKSRKAAFTPAAKAYGLSAPKGALLVGVSGCGKSLTAKAIATAWQMPLLRLDMGSLKSKWVGESEGNIRKALKLAETIQPCVLWLDEVEKALAGATQGAADGGVSGDAMGTILTWMQEKQGAVFVIATANDIEALAQSNPEFLRKGRFDEVFFIDLPNQTERGEILQAALRANKRDATGIDIAALAALSKDFTGAEIAAIVPDAMFAAFSDNARPIETRDIKAAIETVVPLAKTAAEKIARLRAWATNRARAASSKETLSGNTSRAIDI